MESVHEVHKNIEVMSKRLILPKKGVGAGYVRTSSHKCPNEWYSREPGMKLNLVTFHGKIWNAVCSGYSRPMVSRMCHGILLSCKLNQNA